MENRSIGLHITVLYYIQFIQPVYKNIVHIEKYSYQSASTEQQ